MFQQRPIRQSGLGSAVQLFELVYHSTVRNVRKAHGNALMALVMNMLQVAIFVLAFYVLFSVLGLRSAALRGDFLLYIMSGIFLYITHSKTLGAVVGSEGPASPMMKHAPMNTIISILAAALSTLYIQVLSLFVILFIYDVAVTPFEIQDPASAFGMVLIAWFTGLGLGVLLLSIKPWFPTFVSIFTTIYQRANMIASGKMFVANTLPAYMLAMFDWNPLFHCIDQSRGYVFINYFPRYTSWEYALWVGLVLLMIGMMGEFYTRRHASLSWGARR
ncbi:ABC-type polysaccharide/polyol phosphate export permease [Lutimaribacter pacificus]|uniref:ABC-type polysaccharide/polyol phosphate export permease n=1 Tax=Lutimaribacter pacificus TaxID=391948 RepID=A0A1H0E9M3_9RHOB|nr:ABC transporter permease [Lutimaribacter pacificus]SDN79124.1 ABC-type polysaccharide/polyol phosphate export permease [Lutimaribacter pacificus]SHK55045.1 ABC-type polysaccharide/polyol phosphate export permease [Lutimaribacter pacificus]